MASGGHFVSKHRDRSRLRLIQTSYQGRQIMRASMNSSCPIGVLKRLVYSRRRSYVTILFSMSGTLVVFHFLLNEIVGSQTLFYAALLMSLGI